MSKSFFDVFSSLKACGRDPVSGLWFEFHGQRRALQQSKISKSVVLPCFAIYTFDNTGSRPITFVTAGLPDWQLATGINLDLETDDIK